MVIYWKKFGSAKASNAIDGNIKNFLIREGIHHIREIDYSIREKYEQYLMKEKKPEQVLRYLKTLDRIKQYHIRQEIEILTT